MRYNRSKNIAPSDILLYAVAVLLCAVLISAGAVAGNWARYRTSDSGSDSATVIGFGTLTLEPSANNSTILLPGEGGTWQAHVSFGGSEAQTYVFLRLSLADGWSVDGTSLTSLGGEVSIEISQEWSVLSSAAGEVVLYMSLDPQESADDVPIFANNGKITVSATVTQEQLATLDGMFSVKAFAVQGNGFSDADAAWSSISGR